jgi:broad specificity phosphatase PhoE
LTETHLGLLRHGQTDWNIDLRLQGSSDIPLNETGIRQAELAAKYLNASDWDLVLSSPLSRAHDTAKTVAAELGLDLVIVPELIERSFGVAEGMSHSEWRTLYESHAEIPGIESLEALQSRSESLLIQLATEYDGKRILAVSHGALIRKLMKIISAGTYPLDGDRLGNVSLNRFTFSDGVWSVSDYNPASLSDLTIEL